MKKSSLDTIAVLSVSNETLLAILVGVGVVVALLVGVREWARQRTSKADMDKELLGALQAVRRGIASVSRRMGEQDRVSQGELKDVERLILDVEHRLTERIIESREILQVAMRHDGGSKQSFNFRGQTNAQVGDGENNQHE